MHLQLALIYSAAWAALVSSATVSIKSSRGDSLPDFSFSGYRSSEKAIPNTVGLTTRTLSATSGDQSQRIQDALNSISTAGGGILLLNAGNYQLGSGLVVPNSTILRGSGITKTFLLPTSGQLNVITLGQGSDDPEITTVTKITDVYVPAGSAAFNVTDSSKLKPGQKIMVQKNITDKWVRANGMADLVRNGARQTWISAGTIATQPRQVKSVKGSLVTIDIPLTDSINTSYTPGSVGTYTFPDAPFDTAVESLSITLNPTCSGRALNDVSCNGTAVYIPAWVTDSWARNLNLTGFNHFVVTDPGAMRLTIENVTMYRNKATDSANGYPADISILGTQILVNRSSSFGPQGSTSFPVVTQKLTAGPNAILNFYSQMSSHQISPHQRWGHGLLIENSRASLLVPNRGTAGTGQGWSGAFTVAWNVNGSTIDMSSPPLATNWCIGCRGNSVTGNATFINQGATSQPYSLFKTQLGDRGF